jgi:8-amino-7-oxononanoate synthase
VSSRLSHPLDILAERLGRQREAGLERRLTAIGPSTGRWARVRGRRVLLMASNDYLGLAGHPRLAQAAARAAEEAGSGSGASRLAAGTLDWHRELEARIAAFKEAPAALFFSTGYMTNLGVVAGLAGPGDLIVSDELNHASLIDACRLSRAEVKVYPHCDWRAAQSLLAGGRKTSLKLLVSDGVFSMDGDLAPVPELLGVAQEQGALLVVDDAHATGVWGATGRGTVEHYGLTPCADLVMIGTFSKALGGLGGFAAGDQLVIDSLIHRARSLLYTTAPPPAQAAVAAEGLRLVDEEAWRRDKLHELCARLRRNLADIGMTVLSEQGPIVPVLTGTAQAAVDLSEGMLERGIYAPAMRPPTVPEGKSRVRITVSAAHEEEDMDLAAEILAQSAGKAGAA